jgi:pyruvate,orthophosphate dikinase
MHGGWPKTLTDEIAKHVAALEKKMGRKLGDAKDPLLVSVRSGAKFSMPGMMDTVLNLGLNDKSVVALASTTNNERFAYDSYRRFISMYGRIVLGLDGAVFEHALEAASLLPQANRFHKTPPSSCVEQWKPFFVPGMVHVQSHTESEKKSVTN